MTEPHSATHSPGDNWRVAADLLRLGELVVFPTDTVYGVGCLPFQEEAIKRLYLAKARDAIKAIPVLLSGFDMLPTVALQVPESVATLAKAFWPGALTLVVPRRPELPQALSQGSTVAVRVPDHDDLRALILSVGGALAATSANLSGEPDAVTADAARQYLGEHVSLVIDGGQTRGGVPSTVVDCTNAEPKVLRQGAISDRQIAAALGNARGEF